eukprot:TRINITY_DN3359_c0_g1_i6.p1 TRINITY_DN3359_c0_g1~~TRINITY_DN3359_c0_g1_i6.p1  ORF type:complete len:214 (-),score=53.15 TRINITY_DN3359_c0_g1_i6:212-853(-)
MDRSRVSAEHKRMRDIVIQHSDYYENQILTKFDREAMEELIKELTMIFDSFKAKNYEDFERPLNILGQNILHVALSKSDEEVIQLIFKLPKDVVEKLVRAEDSIKRTPLHVAAAFGLVKFKNFPELNILEELFKAGANPNAETIGSETPLIRASEFKHLDVCKILIEHGADPEIENKLKYTALTIWEEHDKEKCKELKEFIEIYRQRKEKSKA